MNDFSDDETATPEEMNPLKNPYNNGNRNNKKPVSWQNFDEILEMIGSEGKFQKFLLYAVICPIAMVSPFLLQNNVFMWDVPDHFCNVPGNPGMELEAWKNKTLPWETGPDGLLRHSQCHMIDQTTGDITQCQFGWEYDKTDYETTIPSEFNWVCDKDNYATDCFTWTSIGNAIGGVLFGIMADRFGRKSAFYVACFTNLFFKTASIFYPQNFLIYKILQLLGGLSFHALLSMPALISAEVSSTAYRSWIYAVTSMMWGLSSCIIPFVALICRGWFLFGCVAAIPGFFIFVYYPLLHESPRWLVSVGERERAVQICLKIAKINGRDVNPEEIDYKIVELVQKIKKDTEGQTVGVLQLFSKNRIAKNTTMLIIAWTMKSLLYNGAIVITKHMTGQKFLNYFLFAIIKLPGAWIARKLVEKTGRRWTQTAFFCFCTASCLICAVAVSTGQATIVIIGGLGIKFGVTMAYMVADLQTAEIFPTQLRLTGSGLNSLIAYTATIIGQYIVYSGYVHISFPYAILCIYSIFGLLSAAMLPETYKHPLPETTEDANKLGKGQKFWSYLPQPLKPQVRQYLNDSWGLHSREASSRSSFT